MKINISLSVLTYEGGKRFLYLLMAIPTFVIGSLPTSLTIFVCFFGSEKSGLSGSEKKEKKENSILSGQYVMVLQTIVTLTSPCMAH